MLLIFSGEIEKKNIWIYLIILCFANRYVYSFIESVKQPAFSSPNDHHCFEPRPVQLERTGTIKIVTISALISHFLPYFNSSVNPIIYNIMSGTIEFLIFKLMCCFFFASSDKFRLKFRELFASCCCCCCCKTTVGNNSSSMPFKSSGGIQYSPGSTIYNRSSMKTKQPTTHPNPINQTNTGTNSQSNSNHLARHTEMTAYAHNNGPICFRLTNV